MRLGTAIEHLVEAYKYASDKEWIKDKVAWALYHTWKEADRKTEPKTCEECKHWNDTKDGCADRHGCKTTEDSSTVPTSSILEQVDKDINVRSKDEPQTDCETCRYAGECDWEPWQECPYAPKDEPQK